MRSNRGKDKSPQIENDDHGPFFWETFFAGGKQKRRKVRHFVIIDGEAVNTEDFLQANAVPIDLHDLKSWELA